MLVIEESNERKYFIFRSFVCDIIRPSKELPVQRKLLKRKNKVWKLWTYFKHVLIVDFEQANVCQVYIEKISTFKDKIDYIMCIL